TEDQIRPRLAWVSLTLSASGAWLLAVTLLLDFGQALSLAGAVLLAGGQAVFTGHAILLYRHRRRRIDVHMPFVIVAIVAVLAASGLLVAGLARNVPPGDPLWLVVGWLAIGGTALTAIQGFFYKITTFLIW